MIIGIDPGFSGGIAFFENDKTLIKVIDMPTKTHNKKQKIDGENLSNLLLGVSYAFIEDVGTRPKQGIVSAFSFGQGLGTIIGVCNALKIQTTLIKPQAWQGHFGLTTGTINKTTKKREIATLCSSLYPQAPIKGPRGGILDGRSDAILIARYGLFITPFAHNAAHNNFGKL